ncbi:glycoside hydrolase family 16 protein [Streptomyces monticola]|uniref:Beta-glucanase n=1 Tax=Streptomyces monticola TaxID=2666263 RepID=A0ABW2JZ86_9ACTN
MSESTSPANTNPDTAVDETDSKWIDEFATDMTHLKPIWEPDSVQAGGGELKLLLMQHSGAAVSSKQPLGRFGRIDVKMKAPQPMSGVLTAFHVITDGDKHSEIAFEHGGTNDSAIWMNYHVDGAIEDPKDRIPLGFEASAGFHTYSVAWTPTHLQWIVDDVVKRTVPTPEGFSKDGSPFVFRASIGNADDWESSDTGVNRTTDWSKEPFTAHFQSIAYTPLPSSS